MLSPIRLLVCGTGAYAGFAYMVHKTAQLYSNGYLCGRRERYGTGRHSTGARVISTKPIKNKCVPAVGDVNSAEYRMITTFRRRSQDEMNNLYEYCAGES